MKKTNLNKAGLVSRLLRAGLLACGLAASVAAQASEPPFVVTGAPDRFLTVEAHGLVGGVSVTQNYRGCFPAIREFSLSMGISGGFGARADIAFRDFLALGIGADLLFNAYKTNFTVANDDGSSMSNVFLNNHFTTLNFPVVMSVRFNVGPQVRWIVDGGIYYAYGIGGKQKQSIYKASINQAGQLVTDMVSTQPPYYTNPGCFINSFNRSDFGLHIGTGFLLRRHLSAGVRLQLGLKRQARTYEAVTVPDIHNFSLMAVVGYRF